MSLPQLRCLVAVVETGAFAAAGRRLGMTTSGVSKTIARLEAARGMRLLHRSTHTLSLTEAGEQVIGAAREAALSLQRFEAALAAAANGAAGRVRMTAPPAFVRTVLAPLLPEFIRLHPNIVLDLRADDDLNDLAQTGVDIALRSGRLDRGPGQVRQPWFRFGWAACASPNYLERRGVPIECQDLSAHDLIGFRNARTGLVDAWWFTDPAGAAERWAPKPRVVMDDAEAAWRACVAGAGIAWAPDWLAADALDRNEVVEVLKQQRGRQTQMSFLRRPARPVPARVAATLNFLRARPPG